METNKEISEIVNDCRKTNYDNYYYLSHDSCVNMIEKYVNEKLEKAVAAERDKFQVF